eukprot:2286921-Amphidinium_carterae.1
MPANKEQLYPIFLDTTWRDQGHEFGPEADSYPHQDANDATVSSLSLAATTDGTDVGQHWLDRETIQLSAIIGPKEGLHGLGARCDE